MKKLCVLGLILALLFIAIPVVADDSTATGNPIQLAGFGTLSAFNQTVADFSANVTSGAAPLTVGFNDLSVNATGWVWYFGDESFRNPWQQMNAADGFIGAFHNGAVAVPDGSIVYCPARNPRNETYRSTDNGATWQLVNGSGGWEERVETYNSMVVLSDGTIVKMGGSNSTLPGAIFYNDTWISTDAGSTWQLVNASSGWIPRSNTAAVALSDDSIVLTGGNFGVDNADLLNDVWSSADKGATWTQINASAGWSPRRVHAVVALSDDSIVLMGGFAGNNRNETWLSADKGYTWTQVNASSGWIARRALNAAAMPDDSIVLLGGITGTSTFLGDAWRSTDKGSTWTEVNSTAFSPRAGPSVAVTSDGSLVVMDGLYTNTTLSPNDVWRLSAEGSTLQNPSHTYTTPGTYQVTLQVFNTDGYNSTRKTGYITVSAPVAPVANFTGTPVTGTAPLTVTFTDLSTNGPTSWNWSFGDGSIENATMKNPVHTYLPAGNYTVLLNASNSAGFNTMTKGGYINVTSVMASRIGIVRDNHEWYLDYNGNGQWDDNVTDRHYGIGQASYGLGRVGDVFVTGDWNGDTRTEIGVVRDNHEWYLDYNGNGQWDDNVIDRHYGIGQASYGLGRVGDVFVTGDWNGDTKTEIGIVRDNHEWYLDYNGNGQWDDNVIDRHYGIGQASYGLGRVGDVFVTGDWNGDTKTEIGIVRDNHEWYLDYNGNEQWDDNVTDRHYGIGQPSYGLGRVGRDVFVTGDWNGDTITEIGIVRDNHEWYLDYNGNGQWDDNVIDRHYGIGQTSYGLGRLGDAFVTGKW